jgi:tungstate transport system substrate-binding protein
LALGVPIAMAALLAIGGLSAPTTGGTTEDASDPKTVRLLTVGAALTDQKFQQEIVTAFEDESGLDVTVSVGMQDIFNRARRSEADIVMAHFGFTELQDFVSEGYGHWPAMVMSNAVAFISPPEDPVGIKDAADPYEAFARIAEAEHPFVVNNLGETLFVTDTVWNAAGQPEKGDWYIDEGLSGPPAVRRADQLDAYTIFGLHPFEMMLRTPQPPPPNLTAVLYDDSLMQRIIATVVVKRPPGRVNEEGALSFQDYLIRPDTQAAIRALTTNSGFQPFLWPAANQNDN